MTSDNLVPDGFAQGLSTYADNIPGLEEPYSRIYVSVRFGNRTQTLALLDTGAPLSILHPEDAALLDLDYEAMCYRFEGRMLIRGSLMSGWVCRLPITLVAELGEDLQIDVDVFIPDLGPQQVWRLPNFLGISILERIRFAVDPEPNRFYFGAFGD